MSLLFPPNEVTYLILLNRRRQAQCPGWASEKDTALYYRALASGPIDLPACRVVFFEKFFVFLAELETLI